MFRRGQHTEKPLYTDTVTNNGVRIRQYRVSEDHCGIVFVNLDNCPNPVDPNTRPGCGCLRLGALAAGDLQPTCLDSAVAAPSSMSFPDIAE